MLDQALAKVADDPRIKPHLPAVPEIFGWNSLSEWSVVVRLRQVALDALAEAGLAVESHQRVIVQPGDAATLSPRKGA